MSYDFGGQQQQQLAAPDAGSKPAKPSGVDEDMFKELSEQAKEVGDMLGIKLQARYEDWLQARRWIEEDWLKAIRAYNGQYEYLQGERFSRNSSSVFVQLTRMKTDSSYNRICDLLLGPEDHWNVTPSPIPSVDPERREQLKQMIIGQMMIDPSLGGMSQNDPSNDELEKMEEDLAKQACKKMRLKIKDQLEFARYKKLSRQTIFEMCVLGTGVFKGPMIGVEKRPKWVRLKSLDDGGNWDEKSFDWNMKDEEEVLPKIASPSLFDVYPDPYATETHDGLGVFERHVLLAHQLETLKGQPYFIKDAVEKLREKYPRGNHWENYTDIELRFISNQNSTMEGERRYDVVEYWGWIDGQDLIVAGGDDKKIEPTKSYFCNVWHCGGITIRATVSPSKPARQIYRLIPYKEVVASQYGVGVPYLMKDSQETVNAAARELINNAALSSGPQVEVAVDLIELDANEDIREIVPWRVWQRSGGDLAYPAVKFTSIPNTTESMAKIIQIWRAFADEETNIPSYSHGSTQLSGAAGKTASGMSMLMGAASMDIKGVVKNWDQYMVKPFIEDMYHFNMHWSDDDSIKGDYEPEATGSTNLLAKEIKSQRVVMLLQMTNNPIDTQIMGPDRRAKLLRSAGESMDIDPDDMAPDPDEVDLVSAIQQQAGMGQQVPGQMSPGMEGAGAAGPSSGATPGGPGMNATPGGPGMNQGMPPTAPATGQ